MPKKSTTDAPRGAKTAAIKDALRANPTMTAKEIAELMKEQGFETTANYVGTLKAKMGGKKKRRKKAVAAAPAAPALPKDAVSIGLLQKAKKLAAQFGSIKEARAAIDALSQLMD